MAEKRLRLLLHGDPKTGKSSFAETCIGPRIIIDAEGGTAFGAKDHIPWRDTGQAPPVPEHDDQSVVVIPQNWGDVVAAHRWLASGQHPFRSYVMDSLTDVQDRAKKAISSNGMDQQAWGILLDEMLMQMTMIRDLTVHPTNPLWTVVIIAHSDKDEANNLIRPQVQGALRKRLGGLYDVVAHLRTRLDMESGTYGRELVIDALPGIDAGDRTKVLRRHFGSTVQLRLDDATDTITPNLVDFLKILNPGDPQ